MNVKSTRDRGLTAVPDGRILDVWCPGLGFDEPTEGTDLKLAETEGQICTIQTRTVTTSANVGAAPEDVADVYLRLYSLSHRFVHPNEVNPEGIFSVLKSVTWTNLGPMVVDKPIEVRLRTRAVCADLQALDVNEFLRTVDYVVPSGVCIADDNNVHLGVHLAEGAIIMYTGFVNFNVGALGNTMVEGRISQGVVTGVGSGIDDGASTMGTFSDGDKERTYVGEHSLMGTNARIGIASGDDCIVEAGLYVTTGARVIVLPAEGENGEPRVVPTRKPSGTSNILFHHSSITGAAEVVPRADAGTELNSVPHIS